MKTDRNYGMYLIDKLTWCSWFFYVLPDLLIRRLKGVPRCKIYYIDGDSSCVVFAGATARLLQASVEPLSFRLVDVRNEQGLLVRLSIRFCGDMDEVMSSIVDESSFQHILHIGNAHGRIPTYLLRRIAASTLPLSDRNNSLGYVVFLVQVVAWKKRFEQLGGYSKIFILTRPWIREIKEYALRFGVDIEPIHRENIFSYRAVLASVKNAISPSLKFKIHTAIFLLRRIRSLPMCEFRRVAVAAMSGKPLPMSHVDNRLEGNRNKSTRRLKVAVEYYGHLNLSRSDLHSDVFFWQQSTISNEQMLLLFGLPSDPLDEKKWAELVEHSIDAFALSPAATEISVVPVATWNSVRERIDVSPLVGKKTPELELLQRLLADYHMTREYWLDIFAAQHIGVYVTWYKFDANHCAIADALHELNGVTAIYQRAVEFLPSPEVATATDVYFGFSRTGAAIERESHSTIPYYVTTGYLGDHRFPLLRENAQGVRRQLHRNGARHILSFFDENSRGDSRWHTGHEFMRDNYRFLLEKVLAEPWLGVVLKPKAPMSLRRRLGDVADLLEQAENTGRCFLFSEGVLHGAYPPAAAAMAADIAVHGHLCAATAGIEAALAGGPTLLLDREGWSVSPLYELGLGKVVFTDWDTIWDACCSYWKAGNSKPLIGDWSSMIDEIDPFRDGRAAERMGDYLNWIVTGLESGLKREVALADAADRYVKAWGSDKVVEISPGLEALKTEV